jgi:GNAT superfamily N-acetyltransferase
MSTVPTLEVRPATALDAPIIRDIVRAAYAKWVPLIGREPLPMRADYGRAVREHQIDLVCEDGAPVALIETIRSPDNLFIENVAVLPERQGRGIGRMLLAHAERKAALAGLSEIRLLTNAAFEANVQLYLAAGYRVSRREPFMGGQTVHMSKTLA